MPAKVFEQYLSSSSYYYIVAASSRPHHLTANMGHLEIVACSMTVLNLIIDYAHYIIHPTTSIQTIPCKLHKDFHPLVIPLAVLMGVASCLILLGCSAGGLSNADIAACGGVDVILIVHQIWGWLATFSVGRGWQSIDGSPLATLSIAICSTLEKSVLVPRAYYDNICSSTRVHSWGLRIFRRSNPHLLLLLCGLVLAQVVAVAAESNSLGVHLYYGNVREHLPPEARKSLPRVMTIYLLVSCLSGYAGIAVMIYFYKSDLVICSPSRGPTVKRKLILYSRCKRALLIITRLSQLKSNILTVAHRLWAYPSDIGTLHVAAMRVRKPRQTANCLVST